MPRFTHLHVSSSFSPRYGAQRPEQLVAQIAHNNAERAHDSDPSPALALTDQDGLYGAIQHIRACIAEGVSPIVGVDIHIASPSGNFPVVIVAHGCAGGAGWAALCRTVSAAHSPRASGPGASSVRHSPGVRPSVPASLLANFLKTSEGPVATVLLGPDSNVGQAVLHNRHDLARQYLAEWNTLLPGGVAVEIVCHFAEIGATASVEHAARMLELAEEGHVPAILTNAARSARRDATATNDPFDSADQLCAFVSPSGRHNREAWLKPQQTMELVARFIVNASTLSTLALPRILSATDQLAERCILDPVADLGWGRPRLPELSALGFSGTAQRILTERCQAAITERYPRLDGRNSERVHQRLHTELSAINSLEFDAYFLTVADVSQLIRNRGIRNQASGSGTSSIVNYLLRVSAVDPLEHGLFHECFLGSSPSTLPSLGIDVESTRQAEIHTAIFERYGQNRAALLPPHETSPAHGTTYEGDDTYGVVLSNTTWCL
ncbi:hypothetical protein GCM10022198_02670 [Klugiella xanthotipulae]|uniref:PHP domain-containing protein n=1 Tax=Klugiella xanthotipulae TaxID=244735 RepID=A0A543HXY4_9MICO|nr:PHP domain-containing protein [Klugiella xanthotipulae]TQM63130.1 PHP domain-containing protein [Klugiella xanthotipulae]